MYESSLFQQEKIKLDTIFSYLIELKSRHIEYELSLQAFNNLRLDLVLNEEKRIFAQIKRVKLSIIKDLLKKIINIFNATQTRDDVNVNVVFKIV
jgi:hemerythrin superfamily protein